MIIPPPASGLRTKGGTPPNPESAAPVSDAGNTLPSTQEDGGASTHIARLRDHRSRAQLALAFDPKPIAGPLPRLTCAHAGAHDADAATGDPTNADPRWLEPGMADIALHLKVAYAKPDAAKRKLANMGPSIDLAISTLPGHAPDHGDITILLRACDEQTRAELPAELRSPQFKREAILVQTYQIGKQLIQMVKPENKDGHELLRAIAASYVAAQHRLTKAELQSLLPAMQHHKAAELLLNVIRVNGIYGLKFIHTFNNHFSTVTKAIKPTSVNEYRVRCVQLMRSGEALFANHDAYKTKEERAYGWVDNPADTEAVIEHSLKALQHKKAHKTKNSAAEKSQPEMSPDEHQQKRTDPYRSQFRMVVRHMQAAAKQGFSPKVPERTVASSPTSFVANPTENASQMALHRAELSDQNTHAGSSNDPVVTPTYPIAHPDSLTDYTSVNEMLDEQNMVMQIFPNEWVSHLDATIDPNSGVWAFFEENPKIFHSDGLALDEEPKDGKKFGAGHVQQPATLMTGAQIHLPHTPDRSREISCETQPVREPQTPEMAAFHDVDYPNSKVRKIHVSKADAAFSEEMGKECWWFGKHRMHPLLNKLCREIQTELGLEIQHPRLRMQYAILLASRLDKALSNLSSTYIQDQPTDNKNKITTILNIRAHTYVAALLGLSGKKQEQQKGEFQILRNKLGSGSDVPLTKAFETLGAQGLHILADLDQMLLSKRVGMNPSKPMLPSSVQQYVNAASILMCKAHELFATERGELPNWVGNTQREERVIAAAIADIQSRKKSVGGEKKTELARKRSRFTSCLPHLREVLIAATGSVSDSHFVSGRNFELPGIGDKRKAAQAFPSRP
jgi:hypothetical protein